MFNLTAIQSLRDIYEFKFALFSTTKFELKKRYAGSGLGMLWVILYPILFLSVYLFLYLAVFKLTYPEMNQIEAIIYIFSGLVPYMAFMETTNSSTTILKQNLHLVKNIVLPLELVPTRIVLIAMTTQCVGLLMIFLLVLVNGSFSLNLLLLPLALIIEFIFILGIALMMAPLGMIIPDLSYFTSLITLLLLFVSPIGFMASMLSTKLKLIVWANPIYYLISPFRTAFLPEQSINYQELLIAISISLFAFIFGTVVFSKFKEFVAEYE